MVTDDSAEQSAPEAASTASPRPEMLDPSDRDTLAFRFLESLPFPPYPIQEEAILRYFSTDEGVLVAVPTGTGKTLIAEAAVFEALHTGRRMYYTTPLIALTDQKLRELQATVVRWGFSPDQVGLVTGNRRVNPDAPVLVVVAEILLNRLLHGDEFAFDEVSSVVMDEFHSFSDPERGIVWEFSLSLLPRHVRLLLLSATVGNANPFVTWFDRSHRRRLEIVSTTERKIELLYQWVADELLGDFVEQMAAGDAETRRTPALVFCFNREECWSVAEELKGRSLLVEGQQKQLAARLDKLTWGPGAGAKLKPLLLRGVGVHHAGLLPKYRRLVEDLFQQKLLSICVCTETLSAGINLPARSVVLPSLMKGPAGLQKIIDSSTAHQIFGRAGRPQFDTRGYVFALAHEDDVKIHRWKEKFDQIPEDTKDPGLIAARKALKKKQPTRSPTRQYWNQAQFDKLKVAPPRDLVSQGALPWRMLAYLLQLSPEVDRVRELVRKRLMEPKRLEQQLVELERMLITLHAAEIVVLDPPPPQPEPATAKPDGAADDAGSTTAAEPEAPPALTERSWLSQQLQAEIDRKAAAKQGKAFVPGVKAATEAPPPSASDLYRPRLATPTDKLPTFFGFRSINPLYALYLLEQFSLADPTERLLALESVLEFPRSLLRSVRVPHPDRLPPGPLARERIDSELVARGLIAADDLYPKWDPEIPREDRKYAPTLAEKLKLLFDSEYPGVHSLQVTPVWIAGDLLEFGGNFTKYISGRELARQEGLVFRHLLRLVLLIGEFRQAVPPGYDPVAWNSELGELAAQLTASCREVDPQSTDSILEHSGDLDLVKGEATSVVVAGTSMAPTSTASSGASGDDSAASSQDSEMVEESSADEFGLGLVDDAE